MSPAKYISVNRQAFFNYEVLERYEAGLELTGTEIKSLRAGNLDYLVPMKQELSGALRIVVVYPTRVVESYMHAIKPQLIVMDSRVAPPKV